MRQLELGEMGVDAETDAAEPAAVADETPSAVPAMVAEAPAPMSDGKRRPTLDEARTPLLKQYLGLKQKHEDAVLFFRMGDFYETFFDDAIVVARTLGIALTSRAAGMGIEHCPMAGVPFHAVDRYLPRLIKAGLRVAICEQLEDPSLLKGKKIVDRGVVEVLTPGTLTDDKHLDARAPNWLLALHRPRRGPIGAAWLELSTGRLIVAEIARAAQAVEDLVARVRPAEVLVADDVARALVEPAPAPAAHDAPVELDDAALARAIERGAGGAPPVAPAPSWSFDVATSLAALTERFKVATLAGMGVDDRSSAVGAAHALVRWVDEKKPGFLANLSGLEPHRPDAHVGLDGATARCLEIVESFRGRDEQGTLLSVLDKTRTAMGARRLREWLLAPLRDPRAIDERLDAVAALVASSEPLSQTRDALREVFDLERLAGRAASLRASPRDLAALRDSLAKLPSIREALARAHPSSLIASALERLEPLAPLRATLEAALVARPALSVSEGEVIAPGRDPELDELREAARDQTATLAKFQAREIERTGIASLKVGYNAVFGYYLEVTHAHRSKVPGGWVRKQTLKNAERFVNDELKELEGELLSARDRAQALESRLVRELKEEVARHVPALLITARAIAEIDAIASLAAVARERGYVRPVVRSGGATKIRAGRHPVIEAMPSAPRFVPNDLELASSDDDVGPLVLVITGPNMAGKSTYIRQAALLVLMAQAGSFVPAESAEVAVVDRIFARVGAADDLARGLSTFMVEMTEAANILRHATRHSLVILDEVGRGTSTWDGVSIAWAIVEHLHDRARARTLFATHYHELTELARTRSRVANLTTSVRETEGDVIFLRKIVPGAADKSYGLHVARLAGVPGSIVERAKEVLDKLETAAAKRPATAKVENPKPRSDSETRAIERLRAIDPLRTTPLDALAALAELRALLGP